MNDTCGRFVSAVEGRSEKLFDVAGQQYLAMPNEGTARATLHHARRLGPASLSRAARLRIVAFVGELEAAMGGAPPRPANPADEPERRPDR